MTKSIQHKFLFHHPAEVVWEYLTKAELTELWLMKSDFEPVVGYDFQFKTRPMPNFNFDGIIYCKVLEIVPFKRLSYSWKGGPGNGIITLDSIVVWELNPIENGIELSLEHSGFKEMEGFSMYSIMNDGWLKNIQKIDNLINAEKNGSANT